jgi:hypothetical protein
MSPPPSPSTAPTGREVIMVACYEQDSSNYFLLINCLYVGGKKTKTEVLLLSDQSLISFQNPTLRFRVTPGTNYLSLYSPKSRACDKYLGGSCLLGRWSPETGVRQRKRENQQRLLLMVSLLQETQRSKQNITVDLLGAKAFTPGFYSCLRGCPRVLLPLDFVALLTGLCSMLPQVPDKAVKENKDRCKVDTRGHTSSMRRHGNIHHRCS